MEIDTWAEKILEYLLLSTRNMYGKFEENRFRGGWSKIIDKNCLI